MKKVCLLICAILSGIYIMAQPPKGHAKTGMVFGAAISKDGAIAVDELPAMLLGKNELAVKVRGKVTEVCKMEGCWIKMETASGPMLIRTMGHAFFVPLALHGKNIVVDGTATLKETSVEMLRHYAQDAGKNKAEIEAIKEPKQEITIEAKGILVL